jgi:hypothetical protein
MALFRDFYVRGIACGLGSVLLAIAFGVSSAEAQQPNPPPASPESPQGTILLTIFLKHDQSKTLEQINAQLRSQGFYKAFPPAGTKVVSWYVMMGIGQVVTLQLPPEKLREVNRAIEQTAWGGYRTEFYPTYDYKAIGEEAHAKAQTPPCARLCAQGWRYAFIPASAALRSHKSRAALSSRAAREGRVARHL